MKKSKTKHNKEISALQGYYSEYLGTKVILTPESAYAIGFKSGAKTLLNHAKEAAEYDPLSGDYVSIDSLKRIFSEYFNNKEIL